eukprot:2771821-Amphidinium_carterae.1
MATSRVKALEHEKKQKAILEERIREMSSKLLVGGEQHFVATPHMQEAVLASGHDIRTKRKYCVPIRIKTQQRFWNIQRKPLVDAVRSFSTISVYLRNNKGHKLFENNVFYFHPQLKIARKPKKNQQHYGISLGHSLKKL